jgi:hypothetical protein
MLTLLRVLLFLFVTGRKPEDDESEEFEGVDVLTASRWQLACAVH